MDATITIDRGRLEEVVKRAVDAKRAKTHVFTDGHQHFLPQWLLPSALEHSPPQLQPRDPQQAAWYLFTAAYFERRVKSPQIVRQIRKAWGSEEQWIFNPYAVAERHLADIEEIFAATLNFGMNNFTNVRNPEPDLLSQRKSSVWAQIDGQQQFDGMLPRLGKISHDQSRPEQYRDNARKLVRTYDGDPRRLIDGLCVEEARARVMQLGGFGTGITNLLLTYYMDRDLAHVTDPHNLLPKVDVHKGRIPLNTNAILVPPNINEVSRDYTVELLEPSYREACNANGIHIHEADAALWILGSEVCAQNNKLTCLQQCPVYDLCEANTPTQQNAGTYHLRNDRGEREDSRVKGIARAHAHTLNEDLFK